CVLRHRVTHLHPMPSRITRNSHRPRASDRTMVASEATSSLAALLNSTAASPAAEKLTRMNNKPNFSREVETSVGWISRKKSRLRSRRSGCAYLSSPDNWEPITGRALYDNHNKDLKNLFRSAAISASIRPGPLQYLYVA